MPHGGFFAALRALSGVWFNRESTVPPSLYASPKIVGKRVDYAPAHPAKRARKAAGITGKKQSKRFYRNWRYDQLKEAA